MLTTRKTPAAVCRRRILPVCLLLLGLTLSGGSCFAEESGAAGGSEASSGWQIEQYYIYTSLYTKHFHPSPEHDNHQRLIALELDMRNHWVFGLASFDNSFGQRSEYLYAGYRWALFHSPYWYFKLTGGLLYGYKEPYQDKIPFNNYGIAPAAVPTLGFQYKHVVAEFSLGGVSTCAITAGIAF